MSKNTFTIPFQLKPPGNNPVRMVQLTDCHLYADADTQLQGINTRESFDEVCRLIAALEPQPDLLLATGDLTQDGSEQGYRYLAQAFKNLNLPTFWIPGNHDDVPTMLTSLTASNIFETRQIIADRWQIILLDSTLPGETPGRINAEQFDFLQLCLKQYPEKHALVSLHHQALPAGSEWIDAKGLQNQEELRSVLSRFKQTRAVLWGHVHQALESQIEDICWMSTPSTCVQFKPGSKDFATDDLAPGFRILELGPEGEVRTRVVRCF
ncbi:MAG: 3',5'-cyclic-AMP phosphodiesterase [Pseudomonadota bacterium]